MQASKQFMPLGVVFLLLAATGCGEKGQDGGMLDEVGDSEESTSEESTGTSEESTSEESTGEESTGTSEESTSEESTSETSTTESTSEGSTSEESTSEESTSEGSTSEEEGTTEDTFDSFDTFFVPDDDFGNASSCDPFAQDCPDGEKCVPYASGGQSWDANKCVPVLGDTPVGEACISDGVVEGTDDCDGEGFCFFEVCTGFCEGSIDDPQCGPGFGCVVSNDGSINACQAQCDPLAQDCAAGHGCYFASDQFLCLATSGEGVPAGEPCGFLNDCAAGSACIDASVLPDCLDSSCCSAFCEQADPLACVGQPGTICGEFTAEVGVCLLP
ncbi:ribulose phosphate epimerase [Nannocystaceae bacterium ST9]